MASLISLRLTAANTFHQKEKRSEYHATLRFLLISLLHSLPLVLGKNIFLNFLLRTLRHGHAKKKRRFHFSTTLTGFLFYIITLFTFNFIAKQQQLVLRPLRRDYEKKKKKKSSLKLLFPYALIMTKKYNFISALRVLHLDHNKKKFFVFISVLRSLHGISGKKIHYIRDHEYFFLCCYYVHYIVTMIENKYFYFSTTFTTAWLRKNIF